MVNIGNRTSKAIKVIKAKKAKLENVGDWVNLHEYQHPPQVLERFSSCFQSFAPKNVFERRPPFPAKLLLLIRRYPPEVPVQPRPVEELVELVPRPARLLVAHLEVCAYIYLGVFLTEYRMKIVLKHTWVPAFGASVIGNAV